MAEIHIEYREYYCKKNCENFCTQCFTDVADDLACRQAEICEPYTKANIKVIPIASCKNAAWRVVFKGISCKRYKIRISTIEETAYSQFGEYMEVIIGAKKYDCEKVVLDGKVIYGDDPDATWILEEGDYDIYEGVTPDKYICSKCGCIEYRKSRFCPNCGRTMKDGDSDAES